MNASSRDFTEKRTFIRMRVDTPVSLTMTNDEQASYEAVCKDLSGAGMLVQLDQQLPLGAELNVRIKSGKNPFSALAEVARIKTSSSGDYIHGLKIKEINET